MKLLIKFQSISDVITNSSSEIFTVIDERPPTELKELILQVGEQNFPKNWGDYYNLPDEEKEKFDGISGEAGLLKVQNWKDLYNEWLKFWIPENKRSQATPEIWALQYKDSLEDLKKQITISIDVNRRATINWILKNLWVIDADSGYFEKDPETGRIIKRITYEEAEELPEERVINHY